MQVIIDGKEYYPVSSIQCAIARAIADIDILGDHDLASRLLDATIEELKPRVALYQFSAADTRDRMVGCIKALRAIHKLQFPKDSLGLVVAKHLVENREPFSVPAEHVQQTVHIASEYGVQLEEMSG